MLLMLTISLFIGLAGAPISGQAIVERSKVAAGWTAIAGGIGLSLAWAAFLGDGLFQVLARLAG